MIEIAIVDDDINDLHMLEGYLEQISKELLVSLRVTSCCGAERFLQDYHAQYDIILMDIEMPGISGMDAAERIRESDENTILIFVTQMAQYAVKGYQVDAMDFMVKPIEYYSLVLVMRKALRRVRRRNSDVITVHQRDRDVMVRMSDIIYIEVLDHYLTYHTRNGSFDVLRSLQNAERELDPALFYRCNRCYLINVGCITAVGKTTVTVAGREIEVSRARRKGLIQAASAYLGR